MNAKFARNPLATCIAALSLSTTTMALAQSGDTANSNPMLEETLVVSKQTTYANNETTEQMRNQVPDITSVNALIDNLPGVSIQEGDAFGFDDWSTSISIRGYQTNLAEQQVGSTIDGLPNGNSNYGGGAKANRYIDTANIGSVAVSQGTADIASRSLEALGGTIDYRTADPEAEQRIRVQYVTGEYGAERYYARYDSGLRGNTSFWISASHQEATDWMEGSAQNRRDHAAAKLVVDFDNLKFTGYISYDDIHEDNYQRVYSPSDFEQYPRWDQLIGEWTNTPYVNQVYRRGWSTLRTNTFSYGKLEWQASDNLNLTGGVYYHDNSGRGDWVPPYLVNVVNDNGGPETEALRTTSTVEGGPFLGQIFFVDPNGVALAPAADCQSSITFPYGGAGAVYDPACYPRNAIPVQSFRNTVYAKERLGFTFDGSWTMGDINELRAGIWYEDTTRDESRDWRRIVDARVGMESETTPYWTQYSRQYPQDVLKWYVEDQISLSGLTLSVGAKQFLVDLERKDNFGDSPNASVSSDSDVLFSGGIVWNVLDTGFELFAGYAENFKSISDNILERPSARLDEINPETSENIEVGVRYTGDRIYATATYFDTTFDNRIIFLAPGSGAGNDYLIGTDGTYINAGGIESSGFEASLTWNIDDNWTLYGAYTLLDATYLGSGNDAVDAEAGIIKGNDVTGIPENMWVLTADYTNDTFSAGLSAKSTGERAVNIPNTWYAEDYVVVDAYLSVDAGRINPSLEGVSINAQILNLTDETYLAQIVPGAGWLGAARTATLSVAFDF